MSEQERALLTTDEILRLPPTTALVLQAGCAPIVARKLGVPAPTTAVQVRTLVAQHRQGCAVAAGVLLTLAALWPSLQPVWTTPPAVVAQTDTPYALASMLAPAPPPPPSAPSPPSQAAEPAPDGQGPPAALQPMDTGQAPSPQGPAEPRAIPAGLVMSAAPLPGQTRWEVRIRVGDRTPPELHTHAQTERGCLQALDELRAERGAQRDGETIT